MNGHNRSVAMLSMMVVLTLLAACGAPEPTATTVPTEEPAAVPTDAPTAEAENANTGIIVTFEGDQCVYHGPERIPAGQIPLTLDVRDQSAGDAYAVAAYTLEEGKTIEDLRAWTSADSSPLWGRFHGRVDATGGTAQETAFILFEGPFFLSCITNPPNQVTDVLGPIEIEPVAAFPTGRFTAKDGDWVLTFDDDGSFSFWTSGQLSTSGTYSIRGNELTWETDSRCGPGTGKPTYTWTFENDTLAFQVKGMDECPNRQGVLDDIPYQREEWDLVVIGDSSLWGLADAFAAQIEADVGVKVVAHDAAVGGLSAGTVLEWLHSERPPKTRVEKELADDLRQAEVVVMFANPEDSMDTEKLDDLESCIDARAPESPENPEETCSLEAFEAYTADLKAIWAQILELRDGQPTVLRATDIYNPVVSPWKESGAFESCTECWEAMSQAARLAAEAYNIPFLSRYDVYNGLNHDIDPRDRGYIVGDGEHPSDLMNQHTAELLSEMGYETLVGGPPAELRAENAATAVAESGDTIWDMVVLGDSLVAADYSTLPEAYAAVIEEDLGVKVEIQNLATEGESTRSLLTNVRKYPWYREPLQEAEIVLISVGGGDLPRMEKRFFVDRDCGGTDNQDCLRQQLEESQPEWDALLDEISSLADPRETLIRPIIPGILEFYARVYKDQPEDVEVYNSYVVAMYEYMAESCAERGIPVLDLYALYDGPDADPSLPEIADRGDGVHVSNEGDAVIAQLLRDLGYEFVKP